MRLRLSKAICNLLVGAVLTACPMAATSESSAISDNLPIEVQVDLLMTELSGLIKQGDSAGIIEIIPKIRALNIEIPDSLFFLEGEFFQGGRRDFTFIDPQRKYHVVSSSI